MKILPCMQAKVNGEIRFNFTSVRTEVTEEASLGGRDVRWYVGAYVGSSYLYEQNVCHNENM